MTAFDIEEGSQSPKNKFFPTFLHEKPLRDLVRVGGLVLVTLAVFLCISAVQKYLFLTAFVDAATTTKMSVSREKPYVCVFRPSIEIKSHSGTLLVRRKISCLLWDA